MPGNANTLLALVPPEDWRRRTAMRLHRRSPKMLAIDTAYEEYYRDRSEAKASKLYFLLEGYLHEHERRWHKVDRNVVSGGLMEFIHGFARTNAGIVAHPPTRERTALAAGADHARLGVLYLFSNTNVSTQFAKVFLEGGFDVLGEAADFIPESVAWNGQIRSTTVLPTEVKLSDASGAAMSLGGAVNGYLMGEATTRGNEQMIPDAPPLVPPRPPAPPPTPTWTGMESMMAMGAGFCDANTAMFVARLGWDFLNYLYEKITEFVHWTINKIRTNERTVWSVTGKAITMLVKAAVGYVAKSCAPLVGGLIDIGRGIMSIISAAKDRIEVALLRARFDIMAGHPQALANAIESAMNWSIGAGIWTTLKGVASTSLMVVSAGASTIGNVVAAALEFITKTILRIRESTKMESVLNEAKHLYHESHQASTSTESTSIQPKAGSIVTNVEKFTEKYEEWCEASPCIPMITLNSGICGDLMQLMKMFDDTATGIVSQEMFDAAADYFTQLKQYGKNYLGSSGFEFTSASKYVSGLLYHAVNHHDEGSVSKTDAVLSVLASGS